MSQTKVKGIQIDVAPREGPSRNEVYVEATVRISIVTVNMDQKEWIDAAITSLEDYKKQMPTRKKVKSKP